jgi:hypothetical protein
MGMRAAKAVGLERNQCPMWSHIGIVTDVRLKVFGMGHVTERLFKDKTDVVQSCTIHNGACQN